MNRSQKRNNGKDVIVVGAGIGGLAAGYYLREAGIGSRILESNPVPGGRIKLVKKNGTRVDAGVSFVNSNYTEALKLLEAVGLKNRLVKFDPLINMNKNGRKYMGKEKAIRQKYLSLKSNLGLFKFFWLLQKNAKRIDQFSNAEINGFEHVELTEYTLKNYNNELLEFFVRPTMNGHNLSEAEGESLAHFLRIAKQSMDARHHYILPEGMIEFPRMLAEKLDVSCNSPVREIQVQGDRVVGVRVKTEKGEQVLKTDRVVCATPLTEVGKLVPALNYQEKSFVDNFTYSYYPTVVFFLNEKLPRKNWADVFSRLDDYTASAAVDALVKSKTMVPSGKTVIQVLFACEKGCDRINEPDETIIRIAREDMERIHPGFSRKIESAEVVRFNVGQPRFMVDTYPALRRFQRSVERIQGLHLVGDYNGHSMMETSIRAAGRAAKQIAASRGRQ